MLRLPPVRLIAFILGLAIGLAEFGSAQADGPNPNVDVLVAQGEALAKAGNFSAAIEKWKTADKFTPRAKHACLIGLAYTRREYWPQAEVFFARCRQTASASDSLPTWLDAAEKQLAEKLAIAPVAAVKLSVDPPSAAAQCIVSSFAPDEAFGPRVVHLGFGFHSVTVTAPGYISTTVTVDVQNKADQFITVSLKKLDETSTHDANQVPLPVGATGTGISNGTASGTPTTSSGVAGTATTINNNGQLSLGPDRFNPRASRVPLLVMGAGGTLVVIGGIVHATWFKTARDSLVEANENKNQLQYSDWSGKFDTRRSVVIATYGVGLATVITGMVLKYTVFKGQEASVTFGAKLRDGGGVVTLGWRQ